MEKDNKLKFKVLKPEQFPTLLKEIPDKPKVLYMEGELPPENSIYLAVVGTRKFSTYGKEAAVKIISGLSGYPIVIISGLALGIDAIAHRTALDTGLKTISVPGSGLDRSVLHPASNRKLADQIVQSGGTLLSEFEPKSPAGIHTFPRRNRIIAGLSQAVLVIEAPEKSGTSITARLALDYNRDVLAVPGPIFSINSLGSNRLIKQGATPISSSEDLLEALGFNVEEPTRKDFSKNRSQSIFTFFYSYLVFTKTTKLLASRGARADKVASGNIYMCSLSIFLNYYTFLEKKSFC